MKYLIFFLLVIQNTFQCFSQKIITREAIGVKIKIQLPQGWLKVDDEISKNIKTNQGSYNVISIYKGKDLGENIFTLYGDSILSKYRLTNSDLQKLKLNFEKTTLPSLKKAMVIDMPLEKVLAILKQFYKDDLKKYDSLVLNKETLLSKGNIAIHEPILTMLNEKGFYFILSGTIKIADIAYSTNIIVGYIILNKYPYGISGSIEETNTTEIKKFIKNIINLNP